MLLPPVLALKSLPAAGDLTRKLLLVIVRFEVPFGILFIGPQSIAAGFGARPCAVVNAQMMGEFAAGSADALAAWVGTGVFPVMDVPVMSEFPVGGTDEGAHRAGHGRVCCALSSPGGSGWLEGARREGCMDLPDLVGDWDVLSNRGDADSAVHGALRIRLAAAVQGGDRGQGRQVLLVFPRRGRALLGIDAFMLGVGARIRLLLLLMFSLILLLQFSLLLAASRRALCLRRR